MKSQPDPSHSYPAELAASVPHLIGYHPTESLILVTTEEGNPDLLGAVVRIALPTPAQEDYAVEDLARLVENCNAGEASLVVIAASDSDEPPEPLPHANFVRRVAAALADVGVFVNCQVWAAVTREGAPWCTYDDPREHGTLPDPDMSPLAAETAFAGRVTYGSREELFELITPDASREVLNKRAGLLLANDLKSIPHEQILDAAINRFEQGDFELADQDYADLGTLLSDPLLRDAWIARCGGDQSAAAEHLVLSMVRGLPEPWRAHAAAVYAFSVYLRGQGTIAGIAIAYALDTDPQNRLANLLAEALRVGVHPDGLRDALNCVSD
ncbi:DUF4192 domain-containing protein [Saccharothrix saharensis]|uniref:DUF4192 domain-containing protein n=1 Tax=Saccharothrix saharensis TaxID=571190 RepID=UPI0036C835F1